MMLRLPDHLMRLMAIAVALLACGIASASSITVTVKSDNTGIDSIAITNVKGAAGATISALDTRDRTTNAIAADLNDVTGGKIPATGALTIDVAGSAQQGATIGYPDSQKLEIETTLKGATEQFFGIVANGTYLSKQEGGRQVLQFRTNGLPFGSSTVRSDGSLVQYDLVNSSTTNAYVFNSLVVYSGLSMSYLGTSQFDSAAAIATGSEVYDFVAQAGTQLIPFTNAGAAGEILLPGFTADLSGYNLVVGTAQEVNSDGSLGPQVSFSLASVPEPSSLLLGGTSVLALAAVLARAGRGRRRA